MADGAKSNSDLMVVSGLGRLPTAPIGNDLPAIIAQVGDAARFAWEEFFEGELPNQHTRTAYLRAVRRFLGWCEERNVTLDQITPGLVGQYLGQHTGSIPTKKLHLAAIRRLFDRLVIRHVIVLNPALSVRAERYEVIEGKTPEIGVDQARVLLRSISTDNVVGLRDRAIIGVLIYTAVRVGAVAKLRLTDLQHDGSQWSLRFTDKGGKAREIPVRHDLEKFIFDYVSAADISKDLKELPLFRTAIRKTKALTKNRMSGADMCRMVKRRIKDVGLPTRLSPHSFRVTTITDLLSQGHSLADVQYLAGHADPRTTRLYDRRQKRITRNIVERISI